MIGVVLLVVMIVALFTSVITNICLCLKCKQSTKRSHDLSQATQPIYETAAAVVERTTHEEEVGMENNMAYGRIRRATQL